MSQKFDAVSPRQAPSMLHSKSVALHVEQDTIWQGFAKEEGCTSFFTALAWGNVVVACCYCCCHFANLCQGVAESLVQTSWCIGGFLCPPVDHSCKLGEQIQPLLDTSFWVKFLGRLIKATAHFFIHTFMDLPNIWGYRATSFSNTVSSLVGGLEHEFYFPHFRWDDDPIWLYHIFQRGRYTTNQILFHPEVGIDISAQVTSIARASKPWQNDWSWNTTFSQGIPMELIFGDLWIQLSNISILPSGNWT